jgi:hypothetical protein
MTDAAGFLLVLGPIVGAIPIANPSLIPIWSMSRDDHIATVGAHRVAWGALNAGFGLATISTTAGLVLLALETPGGGTARAAALIAATVAYAFAGAAWCAVLAVRARTTPALADFTSEGADPGPAERLLGAALSGLFAAFVLVTAGALVGLGLTYLIGGGVAVPIAAVVAVSGIGVAGWLFATGDVIPAVLYPPTMLLGVAILVGWT